MKIKESVVIFEIDDSFFLVDTNEDIKHKRMIKINSTTKRIVEMLMTNSSIDCIVCELSKIYNIENEVLMRDISYVLKELMKYNFLQNE